MNLNRLSKKQLNINKLLALTTKKELFQNHLTKLNIANIFN